MDIRSPLLDSKIARDNIMGAGLNVPEVNQSFEAIDSLGALYDALKAAQKTVNPTETPEARALRYEQQFTKSVARAREDMARLAQVTHRMVGRMLKLTYSAPAVLEKLLLERVPPQVSLRALIGMADLNWTDQLRENGQLDAVGPVRSL